MTLTVQDILDAVKTMQKPDTSKDLIDSRTGETFEEIQKRMDMHKMFYRAINKAMGTMK